jgi:hypothetical protein
MTYCAKCDIQLFDYDEYVFDGAIAICFECHEEVRGNE